MERTRLRTVEGFPSLLRWLEVSGPPAMEMVPPVTHACETVERKTAELARMASDPSEQPVQRLSLSLQGVIDAAVNGGVAKYRQAFLSEEEPLPEEHRAEAARLRRLMAEQVGALEAALAQHERLVSADMRPLHEHLCRRWRQMKAEMEAVQQQQQQQVNDSPSPPLRTLSRKYSGADFL